MNEFYVSDIDECDSNTNKCDVNADCTDTQGSYSCSCRSGFMGDGINCASTYIILLGFTSIFNLKICSAKMPTEGVTQFDNSKNIQYTMMAFKMRL